MRAGIGLGFVVVYVAGCHLVGSYSSTAIDDGGPHEDATLDVSARDAAWRDAPVHDGLVNPFDDGSGPTICGVGLPGLVVCTGFEDPAFGGWLEDESLGTVTQDTTRSHLGRGALHAETTEGGGVAALLAARFGPFMGGDLYARAYFYLQGTDQLENVALMIVGESQSPWDHVAFSIGDLDAAQVWIAEISRVTVSSIPMPFDRWVCIQIHIGIDDSRGLVELFIDGQRVARRAGVDTLPARGYSEIGVGLPWTNGGNPPAEVWVDELVLATAPVPCD